MPGEPFRWRDHLFQRRFKLLIYLMTLFLDIRPKRLLFQISAAPKPSENVDDRWLTGFNISKRNSQRSKQYIIKQAICYGPSRYLRMKPSWLTLLGCPWERAAHTRLLCFLNGPCIMMSGSPTAASQLQPSSLRADWVKSLMVRLMHMRPVSRFVAPLGELLAIAEQL